MQTKFYTFRQNNSGGWFEEDDEKGIGIYVIVEAYNEGDANERAERIGIYFYGCHFEIDCDCCGDRWLEVDSKDGQDSPMLYGKRLHEYQDYAEHSVYVHLIDGTFQKHTTKTKPI